jgi:hypothetical protein
LVSPTTAVPADPTVMVRHPDVPKARQRRLYPIFVAVVEANYDDGFAGMSTLTDLVEAMRPIEESYV